MSKKIKTMKWDSVPLDGFPASMMDKFHGFVGLEECTDYGLDKSNKRSKRKKQDNISKQNESKPKDSKKRKHKERKNPQEAPTVPSKRVKLTNGFVVETCNKVAPSATNEIGKDNDLKQNNTLYTGNQTNHNKTKKELNSNETSTTDKTQSKGNKTKKRKLGEDISEVVSSLTPEDMLSWAEFKLPQEIVDALMELGFLRPTKIQQLSLPAAIHGRRDILGAAETGSGKTLAFGLPILSGIMKLKEKAELKGLDVYEIPYKKTSVKKKSKMEVEKGNKTKKKGNKDKEVKKKKEKEVKESSEDGYSSGDDDETNESPKVGDKQNSEDFIEEIEVPIRKREESVDEGNDSDEDSYKHLSDMFDSDDLKSSDDDDGNDEKDDISEDDNETDGVDEVDANQQGIGCVKVIDNVEMPGTVVIKTGKPLYALILTPTRELAMQISRHLIAAAKYTGIKVATIVGGMAAVKQERVLRSGPEVVVATPGRLWELLGQGQPHLQQLPAVKFLAIDETDRMLERGHFEELEPLLERLNSDEAHRSARQNFVFSATLTLVHDLPTHMKGKKVTKGGKIINRRIDKMTAQQKIKKLISMIGMTDPKVVDITTDLGTAETLTESRITCSFEHKDAYLYYILKRHPGRTIVFCNSISSVRRLAQLLTSLKCQPLPLHASMPQRQRLKNLERFRDDPHGVLVATDVAARGLDIPDVDHVIHYQVPKTAENYVHRSGRTARACKEGLTILMMEPAEAYSYSKLCRTLNKTSELASFPVASHSLAPVLELVNLARDLDALMLKKRRVTQAQGWRDRVAKEMDMIVDDDDVPTARIDPSIDKALKMKRKQLESMLARPLFPRGFSFKYPTLNDPNALDMPEENALQVMKKAIETGELKKEKRKGKNDALLKLEKKFKKL
ncbi:ATP-dependent RNA helicase DDX24 isoform X1 [Maniola hyperantus]|uniref:ATP-dependent RNA helicase DDX24 isoform X1 n=1 Tax=Aphantopus hyperantus TaxID=2795564 RepID=UPI00156999D6|nr:ATP-dependent RNA helicase DDX24 [Maniola hyperantus]